MAGRGLLVGLVLLIAGLCACDSRTGAPSPPATITVFAAASTSDVIAEAGRRFEKSGGVRVVTSFGASSTLAQQIKAGAKADIFLSADEKWMDDLASAGSIDPGTRGDLLANDLVLIAPRGHGFEARMSKDFALASAFPSPKRLAVADPAHVPAGRYAQQSLEDLGWWDSVKDRLLPAQDVRAALRLVELGEADAGVVYSTDAKASEKVEIVGAFPADSHEPIRYPIAACKGAGTAAARFIEFLRSPEMKAVFETHGFGAVSAP
jgi:molybdate transport system substrate-binding protein